MRGRVLHTHTHTAKDFFSFRHVRRHMDVLDRETLRGGTEYELMYTVLLSLQRPAL